MMVDTIFMSLPSLGNIGIFISVLFFTFTILTVILYAKVGLFFHTVVTHSGRCMDPFRDVGQVCATCAERFRELPKFLHSIFFTMAHRHGRQLAGQTNTVPFWHKYSKQQIHGQTNE